MLNVIIPEFISEKEPLFKKEIFDIKAYGYIERMSSLVAIVNDSKYIFEVTVIEDDSFFKEADLINILDPVDITLKHYCGNVFVVDNISHIQTEDPTEISIDDSTENINVESIRGSDGEQISTDPDTQVESEATQTTDKPNKRCHGSTGPSYRPKKIAF